MHNVTFNPNILFYVNTVQMLCTHYHNRMEELVTEWPTLPACDTQQHDYKIFPDWEANNWVHSSTFFRWNNSFMKSNVNGKKIPYKWLLRANTPIIFQQQYLNALFIVRR